MRRAGNLVVDSHQRAGIDEINQIAVAFGGDRGGRHAQLSGNDWLTRGVLSG